MERGSESQTRGVGAEGKKAHFREKNILGVTEKREGINGVGFLPFFTPIGPWGGCTPPNFWRLLTAKCGRHSFEKNLNLKILLDEISPENK